MTDKLLNCPNCGAPAVGAVCDYCGTHFARYSGDSVVVDVEREVIPIYSWDGGVFTYIQKTPFVNITVERRSDG